MASTKFTQFGQASNTSETEISVGVKGGSNFKRLNNMTATTAPTSTDDGSDGYTVGSTWFDTTTGTLFVCSDSTNGAAVWVAQKVPYLSYVALLRSTIGSDLTIQVLTNTLSESITITYGGGAFAITKPTYFDIDKTTFEIGACPSSFFGYLVGGIGASNSFDFNFIDLDSNTVTDLGPAGVLIRLNIYP